MRQNHASAWRVRSDAYFPLNCFFRFNRTTSTCAYLAINVSSMEQCVTREKRRLPKTLSPVWSLLDVSRMSRSYGLTQFDHIVQSLQCRFHATTNTGNMYQTHLLVYIPVTSFLSDLIASSVLVYNRSLWGNGPFSFVAKDPNQTRLN